MVFSSQPGLRGTCSVDQSCTAEVPVGTTLTLTAKTAGGSVVDWDAPCVQKSVTTCTLMFGQAAATVNATAVFRPPRLTLQVSGGTLVDRSAGISCHDTCTLEIKPGTQLHLVATPDQPGEFTKVAWGGLCANAKGSTCDASMPGQDAQLAASIGSAA